MTYATTQQPAMPDDVVRAAYATRLGPLTGIHARAKMIGLLAVAWALTVIMAFVAWNSSDSNASRGDVPVIVPILMVGVPLGLAIWATVMNPLVNPKVKARKVYTFTDGFIEIVKGEARPHRFDSVAGLYQAIVRNSTYGVQTSTNYTYRIIFADGSKTKMTNFTTDMSELGPLIMKGVTNAQLPSAIAAIQAGHTVAFGPVTVNAQGIATDSKPLTPWTQIVKVDVVAGNVRFYQAGKRGFWATFQCAKVPNLYTFIWLTERLVNGGSI